MVVVTAAVVADQVAGDPLAGDVVLVIVGAGGDVLGEVDSHAPGSVSRMPWT